MLVGQNLLQGGTVTPESRDTTGFTLIELLIAMSLSVVVVGILSVCFAFALRVWEGVQNEKTDPAFQLIDLLQRQLAECEVTPIRFGDGSRILFAGQPNSITFVTSHSLKAISQGVSIVVNYTYDSQTRVLSYSELVLDPYHGKITEQFLANKSSGGQAAGISSYGVDFPEFALAYAGREEKQFQESWQTKDDLPLEVLVKWRGQQSTVLARRFMVNAPFSIDIQKKQVTGGAVTGQ
jgi:prepilin-type N-terminal cleavage/methylation domain-containing protein